MRSQFLALSLLMAGLLSGQANSAEPSATDAVGPATPKFRIQRGLVYVERDQQSLRADVYVPESDGPHPAVLVVHGGAWMTGRRTQLASVARRLAEAGVRFIEVTAPVGWDHHFRLKDELTECCAATDQPAAALLRDLKQPGLVPETLGIWAGECGRTPYAQSGTGRDHNNKGYTLWMAGGGVKGGMTYGATDQWGYKAVENKLEIHDLHATLLHLLGIDHTKLTYRFSGRDIRLTDVYGNVVKPILA